MIHTLEFKQYGHLNPALSDPATKKLNAEKLIGRWLNTDPETNGLTEVVVEEDDGQFTVSAVGVGTDGPIAWPKVRAKAMANLEEEGGQRATAVAAKFEFGFMTADTHIRVNKGVLVIVLFLTFNDGSGRSNYVTREFFYRKA